MKPFVEFIQEHLIVEGIDFDPKTKTVSYNPSHEDNVDTSIENNPSVDSGIVPDIEVWSIFKRKRGNRGDGNPLIYALKGEGWTFKSKKDEQAIKDRFNEIATKFVKEHNFGISIIAPSSNPLNAYISDVISSKTQDITVLNDVICKLTTEEVDDIVLDFDSEFRKFYKNEFNTAYNQLSNYLDDMDEHRKGVFTRHLIKDAEMRDILDKTFKISDDKYAKYANVINDKDVLIIDDTISRGQTIKEICSIIQASYSPKSITVLTLLSKLS